MEKIALNAASRNVVGKKLESLRSEGMIPAVLYGNKIENINLSVEYMEFRKAFDAAGENTIIQLKVGKKILPVLVYDVQYDHVSGKFSHIDFLQVKMNEEVEAAVPVEFVGESEAVKALGGVLVKNIDEIEVTCLPGDIPQSFVVDISKLATFDDDFTAGDLEIPKGVEIDMEKDFVIATVQPPRSEEELASLDEKVEGDVSQVEGVVKEAAEEEKKEEKKK